MKTYKVYDAKEVKSLGKVKAEVGPHTDVVVMPSSEGSISIPGRKCEHGGYIPSTSVSSDHAPYCSVCYPYQIELN